MRRVVVGGKAYRLRIDFSEIGVNSCCNKCMRVRGEKVADADQVGGEWGLVTVACANY